MKQRKPLPRSTKGLTRKAPLRSSGKVSRKRDTPPTAAATERDTFPRSIAKTKRNFAVSPATSSGLTRSAPLQRGGPLPRSIATMRSGGRSSGGRSTGKRAAADQAEADAFKVEVERRAHGRCQACPRLAIATAAHIAGLPEHRQRRLLEEAAHIARKCTGWGDHSHHIKPRGMGGHGDHSPENGLYTCSTAHGFIHGAGVPLAYALDLLRRHG